LILSQTLVNVGIGLYYHLNKKYITQKLCENRSNPNLHCNGHCYLSKQLKKAEEGEQKQTQNVLKEKEEIISTQVESLPGKYFPDFRATNFTPFSTHFYISDVEFSLTKPPIV